MKLGALFVPLSLMEWWEWWWWEKGVRQLCDGGWEGGRIERPR